MSRISEEDIQKVREATDIVQLVGERIPLKQKGHDFWCCCPFHNEKTPSCKIDPSTQLWHCFGCGEGGDVFGFVMKSEDLTFPDAVKMLADRAHIDIQETSGGVPSSQKARLRDVCAETRDFYHVQLMRNPDAEASRAREYLASRGLGGQVPKTWQLGFAPGHGSLVSHLRSKGFTAQEMIQANVAVDRNGHVADRFYDRIMFPISDVQGECIAFGGRVIGKGEPKYLNSQETPLFHKSNVLYGLDKAKSSITSSGVALVVEGYTDVITLHETGITNAVATLGTALTLQHIRQLSRYASKRIVYLFDGDAAGQRAADRALEFINEDMTPEAGKSRIELCAVTLPDDLDPADFVAKEGKEALEAYVKDAKPLILYGIDRRLSKYDLVNPEGRTRAFSDALSILAPIKNSLLAKDYAVQLASRLQIREADALQALGALKEPTRYTDQTKPEQKPVQAGAVPVAQLTPAEKSRRRSERMLLSLYAQNPTIARDCISILVNTNWHDALSTQIASAFTDLLQEQNDHSAAQVISALSTQIPLASKLLTSLQLDRNVNINEWARYLEEELEIGDLEDDVAAMNASLRDPSLNAQDQEMIFHALVDLQNTLHAKRSSHIPPWHENA